MGLSIYWKLLVKILTQLGVDWPFQTDLFARKIKFTETTPELGSHFSVEISDANYRSLSSVVKFHSQADLTCTLRSTNELRELSAQHRSQFEMKRFAQPVRPSEERAGRQEPHFGAPHTDQPPLPASFNSRHASAAPSDARKTKNTRVMLTSFAC